MCHVDVSSDHALLLNQLHVVFNDPSKPPSFYPNVKKFISNILGLCGSYESFPTRWVRTISSLYHLMSGQAILRTVYITYAFKFSYVSFVISGSPNIHKVSRLL